jgi:hypothetical protein
MSCAVAMTSRARPSLRVPAGDAWEAISVIECLAGKLGLDPEDLRLQVLAELATIAFSVSGRHWVRHGGRGGREALLDRLDDAIKAIPASLDLSARP